MATPDVPKSIADAAQARFQSAAAKKQRERVERANESGNLLAAETDTRRKVDRIQSVTGLGEAEARELIKGTPPESLGLDSETVTAAEKIQGKTIDFVGVAFLDLARAAAGSVARVIHRRGAPIGSGFLISDRLFLTNNHVIRSADDTGNMYIEFNYELDITRQPRSVTRFELDPDTFFLTSPEPDLDFTLVAVGPRRAGNGTPRVFGYCPISDAPNKHTLGEFVNIIQHPEGDYKQIVLRENQLVTRLDTVLHYVADTSPGSSGSPVFNDQWEPVALHHYGVPFRQRTDANGRPLSQELNEGIRISAIVKHLRSQRDELASNQQSLLDAALSTDAASPSRADANAHLIVDGPGGDFPTSPAFDADDQAISSHSPSPTRTSAMSQYARKMNEDGSISLTIPIEITIRVANYGTIDEPTDDPSQEARRPRAPRLPYSNRRGYDASFLPGFPVAMPRITRNAAGTPARLIRPSQGEDPTVLKYEHFSIIMNADRKMAFVTAVNIDGALSRSVNRDTGIVRPGIAERFEESLAEAAEASETWYEDPRIPATAQSTQALYSNQRPTRLFDRGHQVRREDPNWGSDESAEKANADTFHFTNCCPQASTFNQQARFWQGIERFVLDNARSEDKKVSVFTGPVFSNTDKRYRDVRIPQQFYKVVARVDRGRLKVIAMLASQEQFLGRLPERLAGERFDDLGQVREYQTSVAEIERLTGLDFGPLRAADTFRESAESLETSLSVIRSFEQLIEDNDY